MINQVTVDRIAALSAVYRELAAEHPEALTQIAPRHTAASRGVTRSRTHHICGENRGVANIRHPHSGL